MTKRVVGLTGGVACGKSTVAKAFMDLGVDVIDADVLARQVVAPGTPGLDAIVKRFGPSVLLPDGRLNRQVLAQVVFGDPEARDALNAITHPLIAAAGAEQIRALQGTASPYILYEAALLVETGAYRAFNGLLVVTVSPATQLARLMARDGSTIADARARIASQLPLSEKVAVADWVIHNEGDRDAMRAEALSVHEAILSRFGEASGAHSMSEAKQ